MAKIDLKPLLDKDDGIISVCLPIAANRAIIGGSLGRRLETDLLRHAAARTSYRFFIAARSDEATSQLVPEIARDALPLSDLELDEIVRTEILKQLTPLG